MKDLLTAPFLTEMVRTTANMYRLGWDERNGGNISLLLDEAQLVPYLDPGRVLREIPTGFAAPALAGRYFLITGTGTFFKNVEYDPEDCLGVVRLNGDGTAAQLLWGFSGGGRFTSELPTHLLSHATRLISNPAHRVVMHCHPGNLVAMTFVHDLDERAFTRTLWRMSTECIMFFPDGVGVLPWMVCGTPEIGRATAEKMERFRLVIWAHHGVYAAGACLDEAFGLIETAEKAAGTYLKIARLPWKQFITDEQLRQEADFLGLAVQPGFLEE